ncbi:MAG: hypothetical protein IPL22_22140 [Bacteroidetes bacterium]|nr:hypothetical protein [Bacteroidota bacterium]
MRKTLIIYLLFTNFVVNGQIPTDSLKGHYKFNGTLTDYSGNGNDIIVGSGAYVNDRFGNPNSALYLDGISDSPHSCF